MGIETLLTMADKLMNQVQLTLLIGGIAIVSLLAHYLDAKFQWQLNDWLKGKAENPFNKQRYTSTADLTDDQKTIVELKERIATLEAIVTQPAYELNQQIAALKQNDWAPLA